MAAQLTATKGPPARGEAAWMARASHSLPVPVRPWTRMVISRPLTLRTRRSTAATAASPVSSAASAGGSGSSAPGWRTAMGAARYSMRANTCTRLGSVSVCSDPAAPPRACIAARTGWPNSPAKPASASACGASPSWNRPLRLAARKAPSGENAATPSNSVPTNSGRAWKRTSSASGKWLANRWFSIICADIRTSAMVCRWKPR
ncbi:hypothetical protein D3C72_1382840 [compost metagenome]